MVHIVRTEWAGTSGGPGLTQMAIEPSFGELTPEGAVNAVRAFWNSMVTILPNELTLQVSPIIDEYNTVTGQLIGSTVSSTTPAVVTGGNAGAFAGGSGLKVTWETGVIANGRRVRGSTFVVPVASSAFTTSGTTTPTTQTLINGSAQTLIDALNTNVSELAVWSRPIEGTPGRIGSIHYVTQGICSNKSAIMRSRRD